MSGRYQAGEKGSFRFNGSSLDQLWDVFASSTIDESLRESSAEQLSVLVQGILYICISFAFDTNNRATLIIYLILILFIHYDLS